MNWYKIHSKLSLIALVPVLAWTLSGVMHPLMSNFKPNVKQRLAVNKEVKKWGENTLSIDSVMTLHQWESIQSFRLVGLDSTLYYQIKHSQSNYYVHTKTGQILDNGDEKYAIYLAGLYSEEENTKVSAVEKQESFSNEYVKIARILPVFKVKYLRMDGLRVFVDVNTDQMTYATNHLRSLFQQFFLWGHSWTFLNFNQTFRLLILSLFVLVSFSAGLSGIFVYTKFRKTYKQQHSSKVDKQRKWHRTLGIALSFTLLLFTLSAFVHMLPKYNALDKTSFSTSNSFGKNDLRYPFSDLPKGWVNIQPVKIKEQTYYQVFYKKGKGISKRYFDVTRGVELRGADSIYAVQLAMNYGGLSEVKQTKRIHKFENEYGFINKLLPVQKVQFAGHGHPRWYIDTTTSYVGAIIEDQSALSGFVFAYFHKYHMFDFMGKGFRDTLISVFALGNFLVSLLGFMMYIKNVKKKSKNRKKQQLVT
ncbi:PepSY domain-containing protein [Flammeovirga pacifica]|uniref:PepSY domain-containing protein n=1 Tax=Flammeovirga pacifica TaxID=915059 RepID=A0A1S1YTU1_FLAPC|nr:PepSY domain-containing protein [Flammeovirga pacifica]OHX64426.1 hypothetical protein NH26_22830 [Flammeovirga pacifica]